MKVGFLGTGLMGKPMVERLKLLDYEVVAYNRSVEKTKS
jgi:3-hydroxyisobutyrate dehydrogenase